MNVTKRSTLTASIVYSALLDRRRRRVGAATINGTAGNDTLRGGATADKLNGKGGNDKLYGLGGNDALVGGPGQRPSGRWPGCRQARRAARVKTRHGATRRTRSARTARS